MTKSIIDRPLQEVVIIPKPTILWSQMQDITNWAAPEEGEAGSETFGPDIMRKRRKEAKK